jgi:hypothetical protein
MMQDFIIVRMSYRVCPGIKKSVTFEEGRY